MMPCSLTLTHSLSLISQLSLQETQLFASNPTDHKRVIVFKPATVGHTAGDTTEYDLALGQLPECDGLSSEEEGDDDDEAMDDDEEEEEEMDEDEE